MKTVVLIARRLDSPPVGNQYMLSLAEESNSNFGLSASPASLHAYRTLDDLCEFMKRCCALDDDGLVSFRATLDERNEHALQISEESARRMGFQLS